MKQLLFLLASISFSVAALAQFAGNVTGSIKDGGNQKIIDATISLIKAADSSLFKTALTDREGNFIFENIPQGNYLVCASSLGLSKACSPTFSISNEKNNVNLGTIQLLCVTLFSILHIYNHP